jgi:hypothetical protein
MRALAELQSHIWAPAVSSSGLIDIFTVCCCFFSKKKRRTVQNALCNDAWIRDINVMQLSSVTHLQQFTQLWGASENVQLAPGRPDSIVHNIFGLQRSIHSITNFTHGEAILAGVGIAKV